MIWKTNHSNCRKCVSKLRETYRRLFKGYPWRYGDVTTWWADFASTTIEVARPVQTERAKAQGVLYYIGSPGDTSAACRDVGCGDRAEVHLRKTNEYSARRCISLGPDSIRSSRQIQKERYTEGRRECHWAPIPTISRRNNARSRCARFFGSEHTLFKIEICKYSCIAAY